MRYYTKEWYNSLRGQFFTSGLKVIPDKKYSNKEIKQFYEEALQKEVEHDRKLHDTPPFDPTETIACFKAVYRGGVRYRTSYYPEWLCKEVDKRLLALNLIPQSAYKRLKEEEKANKRAIDKLEKEAERVLKSQDIPEEITSNFRFHDADILALKRVRSDVEMYLNRDGMQPEGETPYTKITFKNVSMLERERGLVFRKKTKNDGMIGSNCQFLYHELYRTEEGYEVHMMLWTSKALRYVTIKSGDIEIEDNIEY